MPRLESTVRELPSKKAHSSRFLSTAPISCLYLPLLSFLYLSLSFQFLLINAGQSVNPKIYNVLDSTNYCFRRLNQTHQIGCASNINGNYGIVKEIRSDHFQEDVDFLSTNGANPPYVAVITSEQFSNFSLISLLKTLTQERVSGILVLDDGRPVAFSADRSCPNEYYSLYANDSSHNYCRAKWNLPTPEHHEGLLFQDLPFPIFLLRNKTEIFILRQKINEFSLEKWPKLAIELLSPMHGAKDSITCLRRSSLSGRFNIMSDILCDPLGGYNIFHHTINFNTTKAIPENSVVVLAARQDSFSMFDGLSPGADSAITSVVTILALADMLNQPAIKAKMEEKSKEKSLLLSLFDGEAFDYIGSSDVVYQLQENSFPMVDADRISPDSQVANNYQKLNLSRLSHFIELNQLGHYANQRGKQQIYLHKNLQTPSKLRNLIALINKEAQGLPNITINEIPDNHALPPSSAQSFLKKRSDQDFAVLVATNHEKEYINKHYNSFYEDGSDFHEDLPSRLTDIATLFGKVAYRLLVDESLEPNYKANETLVNELLNCFLNNSNCKLFQTIKDPKTQISENFMPPLSTYVSVYGVSNILREYTRRLMFRFTGDTISSVNSSEECFKLAKENRNKQFYYYWLNGESMNGECVRSSTYMMRTVSPAYDPETAEAIENNLKSYSIWTESKWQESQLRIFLVSSPLQKGLTLLLGAFLLIVSFVIACFSTKNTDKLFDRSPQSTPQSSISPEQSAGSVRQTDSASTRPNSSRRPRNSNTRNSERNRILPEGNENEDFAGRSSLHDSD